MPNPNPGPGHVSKAGSANARPGPPKGPVGEPGLIKRRNVYVYIYIYVYNSRRVVFQVEGHVVRQETGAVTRGNEFIISIDDLKLQQSS